MAKTVEEQQAEYAAQITACAQALAVADNEKVASFVTGANPVDQLNLFTEGNLEKRFQKLDEQLDELHEVVDNLSELINEYIKKVPLAAYDTGSSDGIAFLDWWEGRQVLTLEQRDFSICQRGRHAVECLGTTHRLAHVHFQELTALTEHILKRETLPLKHWIHLNPILHLETFSTTALLDDEADLPATIAFFPVANNVHLAVLESNAKHLVSALTELQPVRVADLVVLEEGRSTGILSRDETNTLLGDLAEIGLIAFG